MKALETIGRKDGTEREILVATPDGRALYENLGWSCILPTPRPSFRLANLVSIVQVASSP